MCGPMSLEKKVFNFESICKPSLPIQAIQKFVRLRKFVLTIQLMHIAYVTLICFWLELNHANDKRLVGQKVKKKSFY